MHCRHRRIPTGKTRTQPFRGFVWSFISWSANYGGARYCTCQHIHGEPWMWYKGIRFKHLKRVKSQPSSFFCGNVHEKSWKLSLHDTTFKFKISEQAQSSYAGWGTHHFSGDTKLKRCKVPPLWGSHELGAPGLKGCSICQVMVKRSIKIAEIAENNITRPASHILTLEVQDH